MYMNIFILKEIKITFVVFMLLVKLIVKKTVTKSCLILFTFLPMPQPNKLFYDQNTVDFPSQLGLLYIYICTRYC